MNKLRILVIGIFILSLLIPFSSLYAADPVKIDEKSPTELNLGEKVVLPSGETATYLGRVGNEYRYTAKIGALEYIPGTTDKIKPNWAFNHTLDAWVADDNLFDAVVTGTRIVVTKNGQKLDWTPTLLVGGKEIHPVEEEATLLNWDPINENYWGNTLEWDYGVCKRHLRIIEGVMQDLWIFDTNPKADVQIVDSKVKDKGFVWERAPFAYDAEYRPIDISSDKLVKVSELNREDITYPVTVDPTTTYTTSSSDGWWERRDATYSDARTSATKEFGGTTSSQNWLGQSYWSSTYYVMRFYMYFDTSGLPDNAEVSSAVLHIYSPGGYATSWNITIQNGMPTYPHDPLQAGDYLYTYYSGYGGNVTVDHVGELDITLTEDGEDWINLQGYTKLVLRSGKDVDNIAPTSSEWIYVYAYEKGNGYWPQLDVTYIASEAPTVTSSYSADVAMSSATLYGYMNDDGGEDCRVMFEYDVDSGAPYASNTGWLDTNYTTGQTFNEGIDGLAADTTYYWRAVANNTEGQDEGAELTFDTLSSLNPPTNFRTIPRSSTEISATFTKGVGAYQTLVRYKVGEYPSSTTDGELAYNSTGGSFTVEDLTPGTTYWFKAWGFIAGNFSASNITDAATTFIGEEGVTTGLYDAPDEPSNFWGPPDETKLSNLPMYDNFNARADEMGMDRGYFWMGIFWIIAIVLAVAFYMLTKEPIGAIAGFSIGIVWGWQAGPIPGIWLLVYILAAFFIIYVLAKGGANA